MLGRWPLDLLAQSIRASLGGPASPDLFLHPAGDLGLYGPNSIVWKVHAEFLPMMVGGLSSLLLQALHPGALAGVWDHSSFRSDLMGRLGRTARFVAMASFGPQALVDQAMARVRSIHSQVSGTDEFGRPYSADAPELLEWVQLTETRSFWMAWQWMGLADPAWCADTYVAEMRRQGLALGCSEDLPATWFGLEQRLLSRVGELCCTSRTREVIRVLDEFPVPAHQRPLYRAMQTAAFEVLPDWALRQLGRPRANALQCMALKAVLRPTHAVLRQALWPGSVAEMSYRRVAGADPGTRSRVL